MSTQTSIAGAVVGSGLAAGPSMVDVPFYETNMWLSAIAVLGVTVLVLTGLNVVLSIRKKLKDDKAI
jgi:phosphate/sulfate permease